MLSTVTGTWFLSPGSSSALWAHSTQLCTGNPRALCDALQTPAFESDGEDEQDQGGSFRSSEDSEPEYDSNVTTRALVDAKGVRGGPAVSKPDEFYVGFTTDEDCDSAADPQHCCEEESFPASLPEEFALMLADAHDKGAAAAEDEAFAVAEDKNLWLKVCVCRSASACVWWDLLSWSVVTLSTLLSVVSSVQTDMQSHI